MSGENNADRSAIGPFLFLINPPEPPMVLL